MIFLDLGVILGPESFSRRQARSGADRSSTLLPELVQAILSPGHTVARMPSDLQNELTVPSFVEEAASRRPFDGKSAKNKRPGRKAQILPRAFAIQPDTLNRLDLAHSPF